MNFLKSAVADNLAHTQHNTRLFLLAIDLPLIVPLNWIDSVDEAMIFIFDILIMFVFTYCHYPGRHIGSEVFCLVGTYVPYGGDWGGFQSSNIIHWSLALQKNISFEWGGRAKSFVFGNLWAGGVVTRPP